MTKKCKHNCGWYIQDAQLMASETYFTLMPMPNKSKRQDKALAVCNCGCGATRNVYLLEAKWKFGKIRKAE